MSESSTSTAVSEEPKVEQVEEKSEQTASQKKEVDDLIKSIMENQKNLSTLNIELCNNNEAKLGIKKSLRESSNNTSPFHEVYQTPILKYELQKNKVERHILLLKIMYATTVIESQKKALAEKRKVVESQPEVKSEVVEEQTKKSTRPASPNKRIHMKC